MTTIDIRPQLGGRGTAVGLGLSLLAHLATLAWLMRAHAPRPDAGEAPPRMMFVQLLPHPGPPTRTMEAPPTRTRAPAQRALARPHSAHPADAAQRDALPATATPVMTDIAPAAPPVEPATTSTPAAPPAIDIGAARAAARLIAREDGEGLVVLPERKPVVEPNADHHVVDPLERARRADCQTARAGSTNLLANVVMLAVDMAKNAVDDSGCKW